jgi:hypothetical protein
VSESDHDTIIRPASAVDAALILAFIRELASTSGSYLVTATEQTLLDSLFGPHPGSAFSRSSAIPQWLPLLLHGFSVPGQTWIWLGGHLRKIEFRQPGYGQLLLHVAPIAPSALWPEWACWTGMPRPSGSTISGRSSSGRLDDLPCHGDRSQALPPSVDSRSFGPPERSATSHRASQVRSQASNSETRSGHETDRSFAALLSQPCRT